MSFPNCLFLLEYRQTVRQSLFLRIRVIIFVGFTATAWRHRRSSTVASNKGDEFSTTLQVVCNILGRLESFLLGKWRKKRWRHLPLFYGPASCLQFFKIQRDSWANSPTCTGVFSTCSACHFLLSQTSCRKLFTEKYIQMNMKVTIWN